MRQKSNLKDRAVYVVDGSRTPFLKVKGPGMFTAADLAVLTGKALLNRQSQDISQFLDGVIIGCAIPGPEESNIARIIALRLGLSEKIPAYTVMRNCASGMQSLDNAAMEIASGRSHLILAGGTEAMSHAPILFNQKMAAMFACWSASKSTWQHFGLIAKLRPAYFRPVIALLKGLTDPLIGMNMGQTAEELAYQFAITREQMDVFACSSHQRLSLALIEGRMNEIVPIIDRRGCIYQEDTGLRANSTFDKLAQLKPIFDKKYGMVTAGNSSQISDGACLLLLASQKAVVKYKLPVIGRLIDTQWSGVSPKLMGLGPVHAASAIMQRHNLHAADFDAWEINEAFAAQVLACIKAFDDVEYLNSHLIKPMGVPTMAQLNKEGGAIAIGHPIAATGARLVLHLLHSLKHHQGKRGIAALCVGGGQGAAMYLESLTEVTENG